MRSLPRSRHERRFTSNLDADMHVVVRPTSTALAPFIASMGYLEGDFPHARELALPSGTMQLLINLDADVMHSQDQIVDGAALQGASSRPSIIDSAEQRAILWVGFRPGGSVPFFAPPASAMRDDLVPLDALWGRVGATLRERLLEARTPMRKFRTIEAVLLSQASSLAPDPAIARIASELHSGTPVSDVADGLGWTSRRLLRHSSAQLGLTPKRFAGVRRFQRVLREAAGGAPIDWTRIAADAGYHDQAHLIHDFRRFAGMCPTEYAPRSPSERNHVPLFYNAGRS